MFQITQIDFDLSTDDDSIPEEHVDLVQKQLQEEYVGQIFDLDVENPHDDDEVAYELCEEVSAQSGWCINSIDYVHVLS